MNKYSIKIVRRTDKRNAKGENPLILQIIINSRSKKISLKESINEKYWDDKNSDMAEINKRVHFHLGRHTFGSSLVNMYNIPLPLVSKLLGHKNISNTLIYTNSNFSILQNAMKDFRYGKKP